MAPPFSLSSLYLSPPAPHHHHACSFPSLISRPTSARLRLRPQTLAFSSKPSSSASTQNQNPTRKAQAGQTRTQDQDEDGDETQKVDSSQTEKKSFAIATGELFLGIASRLIKRRNSRKKAGAGSEPGDGPDGGGISIVIEDDVEPDVIWEQSIKDVEAEQRRRVVTSPGFSFSAAGLLFPYHLGVAQLLIEKGYIKETTPLAGSSAGAIVCAVIASGASMEEALVATKVLAEDCRRRGTAFRLGAVLREVLDNFLPEDAHTRSNGRVRIAVTQILWRPRGLLVDQFDSREDLINAVVTSSFIPGYLAPQPATLFRNRLCIDGGLTLFMPPTSAAQTVRVCAFPATQLGLEGIGISPDCNPENRATSRELFNWALEPAEDDILDRLFELGYLDAVVWAEKNPVAEVVENNFPFDKNSSA
ncbi:patatin-like phospholipase domain-containing protein 2 [Eucalyptus grandis]|uniref:patatin-like phospholipase domain-containing protein 2 n=1 Tax=Eucalyptus grandis TaxID=71139 RepID=UPI00192EDEBA|nr:patatin-like phospholipase domain-containing protein 2 [Eucalyptus grandis]